MSHRTTVPTHTVEGQTTIIAGDIQDEMGEAIPASELDSLTFSLYNKVDKEIINDRLNVNILNQDIGTVDEDGKMLVSLTPADMVIIKDQNQWEVHVAQFKWTWGENGSKSGAHEVEFYVFNMPDFEALP